MEDSGVKTQRPNFWKQVGIISLLFVALIYVGYKASAAINPVIIAFFIAYMFNPLIEFLEKRGIGRVWAIAMFYMAFTTLLLLILIFTLPLIFSQAGDLIYGLSGESVIAEDEWAKLPMTEQKDWSIISEEVKDANGNSQWDSGESFKDLNRNGKWDALLYFNDGNMNNRLDRGYLDRFRDWSDSGVKWANQRLSSSGMEPVDTGILFDKAKEYLATHVGEVADAGRKTVSFGVGLLGSGLNLLTFWLSFLLLVPFYTFFMMKEMTHLKTAIFESLPYAYRDQIIRVLSRIHNSIAGFLRGMMTICLIKGIVYATGFYFIGVPFSLVLGLLTGAFTIIPLFGVPFMMGWVILFTCIDGGGLMSVMMLAGLAVCAETVDGTFLAPTIMGKNLELHPMWILIAVFAAGELLGLFGMLIAVPMAGVVKILFQEFALPVIREWARKPDDPSVPVHKI